MNVKRCRGCNTDRPLSAFAKWAHRCEECRKGKAVVVATPPVRKAKNAARWTPPPARWSRPSGLGFDACLEVDEDAKRTDIKIEQTTGSLKTQTIWLNQAEAGELLSWLTAQMGDA